MLWRAHVFALLTGCLAPACLQTSVFSDADTGASYVMVLPENMPTDGAPSTAQVELRRGSGAPLPGLRVQLQIDSGTVAQPSAPSDGNGTTQGSVGASGPGEHSITAAILLGETLLPVGGSTLLNAYTPAVPGTDFVAVGTPLNLAALQPTAQGLADIAFRGTVQVRSSDAQASLPPAYTYTAADRGVHVFRQITLQTPGPQTISAVNQESNTVLRTVVCKVLAQAASPATQLAVATANNSLAGVTNSALVYALDTSGTATTNFLGTVHFTSTDANAVLPNDYTFTADDLGQHTFSNVTFVTAGTQTLTVSSLGEVSGQQNVLVTPGLPRYLGFATQPTSTSSCARFAPVVQVQEYDAYGNKAVTFGDTVSLTLNSNILAAALQGNTQVRTILGLATFSNLAVNSAGTDFTLSASIGYAPVASTSFNVVLDTPRVVSVGPITIRSGNIPIAYAVSDACASPVQIALAVDPNGSGVYHPATAAPSDANYLGLTNVPTSAGGLTATFLWNSLADVGHANWPAARIQVIAFSGSSQSSPTISPPFSINNGPKLAAAQTLNTAIAESCVALADINNDDRLDLLTCNGSSGGISTFLGNGMGTMTPATSVGTLAAPRALATGHIDGDGGVDIALAAGTQVAVYLGSGNGLFAAHGTVSLPSTASGVLLVDMNHDGNLDIVTDNTAGSLSVALGSGNGSFAAASTTTAGGRLSGLVAADVNRDGAVDILASDAGNNALVVALGNAAGGFVSKQVVAAGGGSAPSGVAVGDMNHDGALDAVLALGNTNAVSVWFGNNTGAFAAGGSYGTPTSPTGVGVADFDNDGNLDVAASCSGGSVLLLAGSPAGTLTPSAPAATGAGPTGLAIGDIDRDAQADVVTANTTGLSVSVLQNGMNLPHNAHWSCPIVSKFSIAGNNPTGDVGIGDMNGDSKPDIVVSLPQLPGIGIMLSDGFNHLSTGYVVDIGTPNPSAVLVTDLNGDGYTDVVTSSASNDVLIVNLGPTTFLPNQTALLTTINVVPTQATPQNIVAADLNGDGATDLVVPNLNSNTFSVFLNRGDATYPDQMLVPTGPQPQWIALADMNGDGQADAVVAHAGGTGSLGIYLGQGNGDFNQSIVVPTGAGPHNLALGDINADGTPDVVVAMASNTVQIFTNDGHANLTAKPSLSLNGGSAVAVSLLDVDHSRNMAIVAVNDREPWQVEIFANPGNGNFAPPVFSIADYSPAAIIVGDINSDGYADIITSSIANTVGIIYSNGNGWLELNTPTGPTSDNNGSGSGRMTAADFNWDGYLDIAELSGQSVAVKFGAANGLFAAPTVLYTFGTDNGVHAIAAADLNHDGWNDVVAIKNDGVNVTLNNGSGGFGTNSIYGSTGLTAGAPLDYNRDGNIDVIAGNGNNLSLFVGDGTGKLSASTSFTTASAIVAVSLGDYNNDGSLDVLASLTGTLQLFLRQGNNLVPQTPVLPVSCKPSSNASADFNRDGHLDALAYCSDNGLATLFTGKGDGTFGAIQTTAVPGGTMALISAVDLNLDGVLDVVVPLEEGKGVGVYLSDPNGNFGSLQYLGDDVHPMDTAIADFNFDGLPDLASYGQDFGGILGRW